MPIHVFVPNLLSVFATLTTEMATKLIEIFFPEFGIDLDLEISRSNDKLPMS